MVWLESPTNPLLKVVDLQAVCAASRKAGVPVVVDNTFATALVQQPLRLGATLSLTSTTKYINGHSDALGGVVCCDDSNWHQNMVFAQKASLRCCGFFVSDLLNVTPPLVPGRPRTLLISLKTPERWLHSPDTQSASPWPPTLPAHRHPDPPPPHG